MYEHAYALDFGADAGAYIDRLMANLHWERISARYQRAIAGLAGAPAPVAGDPKITAAGLLSMIERGAPVTVVDVCLADDLPRRFDTIPGACFLAPEAIAAWAADLPRDRPVAVTCIYGFQVSGEAVAELRRLGFDARQLVGGLAAWHAMGGPTVPLPGIPHRGEAA